MRAGGCDAASVGWTRSPIHAILPGMYRTSPWFPSLVAGFLFSGALHAQDAPSAAMQALAFLEGDWAADGDSVELGRTTEEYHVERREGGRFLHFAYRMTGADGGTLASETMVLGQDAVMDKLVSFQFAADGTIARGLQAGGEAKGTWTWEGTRHGPRRNDEFRLTLTKVHDDAFLVRLDTRVDERGEWQAYSAARFHRTTGSGAAARKTSVGDERSRTPDRPPRNVRIQIDRFEVDARDEEAFDLALRYRDAGPDVSDGALGGANGVVIFGADGRRLSAGLRAQRARGLQRESNQSFVVALEGSDAMLEATERRAVPVTVLVPVYRGTAIVRTVEEEVTGGGFRVRIGRAERDAIELELAPYFHRARRDDVLVVTELAARIKVVPGRPIVIMAEHGSSAALAATLLSSRGRERTTEAILVLTASVDGD